MDTLIKDIRYGVRTLRRSPGFTAMALLAITLGISANTIVFSTIDATLFHPFAFLHQERLVMVWESNSELGFMRDSVAPGNVKDWREQNHTFDQIVPIDQDYFDLTESDEPERFSGYKVAPNFFGTLGASALYGRT